jgi:hypothetical protein
MSLLHKNKKELNDFLKILKMDIHLKKLGILNSLKINSIQEYLMNILE